MQSKDFDDEKRFLARPEGFACRPSVVATEDVALFFHKVGAMKLYVTLDIDKAKKLCNELYTAIQEAEANSNGIPIHTPR